MSVCISACLLNRAYVLGEGGSNGFGNEALTKLLSMMTEAEYKNGQTIVIMAGYDAEMDTMLARNSGLKSRFSNKIDFKAWDAQKTCDFVVHSLTQKAKPIPFKFCEPSSGRGDVGAEAAALIVQGVAELIRRPGWANIRDAESVVRKITAARDTRLAAALSHAAASSDEEANCMHLADITAGINSFLATRSSATADEAPGPSTVFPPLPPSHTQVV